MFYSVLSTFSNNPNLNSGATVVWFIYPKVPDEGEDALSNAHERYLLIPCKYKHITGYTNKQGDP